MASTGKPRRDIDTAAYKAARLEFLQHNDVCHWCKRAKATTIDHVIEVDRGIDPMDQTNWVGACHKCNAKRGADYLAKKRANQVAKRKNQKVSEIFFENEKLLPPTPLSVVSPKNKRNQAKPRKAALDPSPLGSITPRLETPYKAAGTYGTQVATWASRILGVELMPWQIHALSGQLAHDDAGELIHRLSLVSVARQSGKTVALKALVGWWLTEEALRRKTPQTVITTAHALDLGVALFQDLAPILVEKFGAEAKWSYGRNELKMPDGSMWLVRAATPSAGHGRSPDLVIVDEIWDVSEPVIFDGLIPAQRARKSPLMSCWSTAGTESSKAMLRLREQGLRAIDQGGSGRLYFAEWSIPAGVDAMDRRYWGYANPALGHTISLDVLEAEAESPNRSAFLRASLNLWVATDHSWLEPGTWEKLEHKTKLPPPSVLAIDSSIDESRYCGVFAHELPDETVAVSVAFVVSSESEMWDAVEKLMPKTGCTLAITPTLEIHCPPQYAKRRTIVGFAELGKWTSLVKAMVLEGRIRHTGEAMLAEHIARAVAVKSQGTTVLSSQRSPGPIELARCTVWAAALASRAKWKTKPSMGFAAK